MSMPTQRDTNINIRARSDQRALIDRASQLVGKSRSDFMLESACREALDVVLDQRLIMMDPEAFDAFCGMLDAPPRDNPRIAKLLAQKAPWDDA